MKINYAFTLIELMIVVAIIGILASLGFQQYQNYVIRTYVAEGLTLSETAKSAISEYYASNSALPTSNSQAGLSSATSIASVNNDPVKAVNINSAGEIEVFFGRKVSNTEVNIKLVPVISGGSFNWRCERNNLKVQWVPVECNITSP